MFVLTIKRKHVCENQRKFTNLEWRSEFGGELILLLSQCKFLQEAAAAAADCVISFATTAATRRTEKMPESSFRKTLIRLCARTSSSHSPTSSKEQTLNRAAGTTCRTEKTTVCVTTDPGEDSRLLDSGNF